MAEVTLACALRQIAGHHTIEALTIPEYRAIDDDSIEKAVLGDLPEPHRSFYDGGDGH